MDIIQEAKEVINFPESRNKKTLVDLISRLVDMWEWKPIESAPKDGTRILCNDAPCQGENISIARYCNVYGWETVDLCQFGSNEMIEPTHWMPLPSPPIEIEADHK